MDSIENIWNWILNHEIAIGLVALLIAMLWPELEKYIEYAINFVFGPTDSAKNLQFNKSQTLTI